MNVESFFLAVVYFAVLYFNYGTFIGALAAIYYDSKIFVWANFFFALVMTYVWLIPQVELYGWVVFINLQLLFSFLAVIVVYFNDFKSRIKK